MIELSELAKTKAKELQNDNPQWSGMQLRLYLEGKGCDGFYYGVTFDHAQKDDLHFPVSDHLELLVDSNTLQFVENSTISWVDDERGKGFLVENPKQTLFRGKFFKRSVWKEKLLGSKALESQ